jgi:CDGSH-type Zn-finger protein
VAATALTMAKITCLPNGPYLVSEAKLCRADGVQLNDAASVALCRCGGSGRKPFCDGTHGTNGFSDRNRADPALDRRTAFAGRGITIFDNRSLCAHAGFCTDGLKAVFRMNAEPWIQPDAAEVAVVIAAIEKCPSGALSYAKNGVESPTTTGEPTVMVMKDGPYAIRGGIELVAVPFGKGASKEHYTLCRCGGSNNKPFCDGSHWALGFKDSW